MKYLFAFFITILPFIQGLPHLNDLTKYGDFESSAHEQFSALRTTATENMKKILSKRKSGCTSDTVVIRRDWEKLSVKEHERYIDAVLCVQSKAPITSTTVVPGVRSHFDDFVALHMNQSSYRHWNTYFLYWHRFLVHKFEKSVQECGYKGSQPFWEWSAHGANILQHTLFSGSMDSIGSNGIFIPDRPGIPITIPIDPPVTNSIPAGTGGGCLQDGPFKDSKVNLGPYGPPQVNDSFNYNPRCTTRDFRPDRLKIVNNYANVTALLMTGDLTAFTSALDPIHAAGHASIGGIQDDIYVSPSDIAFYFQHCQIDRVWSIWQAIDFERRISEVTGTLTPFNSPPSEPGTLDTTMDFGFLGGKYTIRELASTIDGPFCYIYE